MIWDLFLSVTFCEVGLHFTYCPVTAHPHNICPHVLLQPHVENSPSPFLIFMDYPGLTEKAQLFRFIVSLSAVPVERYLKFLPMVNRVCNATSSLKPRRSRSSFTNLMLPVHHYWVKFVRLEA